MRHTVRHLLIAGVVASAAVAGTACNRTPAEQEPARSSATEPGTERGDTAITTSVQAKFYADDEIRARHIDVSTDNGVVALRGTVDTDAVKQQAVNLARSVEGVSRVDDQLQVMAVPSVAQAERPAMPPQETDPTGTAGRDPDGRVQPAWITTKIQAQYFVNPEIKPWNIDVTTTSGGLVTLRGEVDSAEDRTEAVRIARETEGVTSVDNKLRVKGESPAAGGAPVPAAEEGITQPDAWLTAKIQAKYFMDDEVKARNIDVDTQDGVVTLKGSVVSESERRQAVALARNTDGVQSVNDQLQVQAEAAGPVAPDLKPVEPVVDDAWIITKIQSKYFLDVNVKSRQITVDTQKGVVTLSGTVETEQQKQEAERIARETEGVSKVVNNLVVGQR